MIEEKFNPVFFLKNAQIQTYLASSRLRVMGKNPMLDAAKETIITTKAGVRLLASYSPAGENKSKGMVMLLHGWEGSAGSAYILSAGRHLFENGYSVFRLNFRDHGNSHPLNEGLFYATLIDEVFQAVQQVSAIEGGLNFFLIGFSLGGNYALRIGRICAKEPVNLMIHRRGGHNGFIEDIFFNCWYEKKMLRLFDGMKPLHDI